MAYAGPDAFVLIDALVDDATWSTLDELVAAHGKPVTVLSTLRWHERSSAEATARYEAARTTPTGVAAIPIDGADETMFWIEEHRALVPGDRLLGDGRTVRPCPETWLAYIERIGGRRTTYEDLVKALEPLLELPVELVLISHGEPILEDGHTALERALQR